MYYPCSENKGAGQLIVLIPASSRCADGIYFFNMKNQLLSTTRAYLFVIAARHFLIDPHDIVTTSMCGICIC